MIGLPENILTTLKSEPFEGSEDSIKKICEAATNLHSLLTSKFEGGKFSLIIFNLKI